jgi:hypothetical protein
VWLATSVPGTDWESGGYFADRKPATASPAAGDGNLAAQLWDRSAQMCGLEPPAAGRPASPAVTEGHRDEQQADQRAGQAAHRGREVSPHPRQVTHPWASLKQVL